MKAYFISLLLIAIVIGAACTSQNITADQDVSKDASANIKLPDEPLPLKFPSQIKFVQILNNRHWFISDNRTLYRTEDSGRSWLRVYAVEPGAEQGPRITGLSFIDVQTGFLIVDAHLIHTSDGGRRWENLGAIQSGHQKAFFTNCQFIDSMNGWVVGGIYQEGWMYNPGISPYVGVVFTTQDGGRSWQHRRLDVPRSYFQTGARWMLRDIYFQDSRNGWAIGDDVIFWTADGGETWHLSQFRRGIDRGDFQSVHFLNRWFGWVTQRESTKFAVTTDGGRNWKWFVGAPQTDARGVIDIIFLNSKQGFAAVGNLFQTNDGGQTWKQIRTGSELGEREYSYLSQANDGTIVALSLAESKITPLMSNNAGLTWYSLY